jgi:anaerobic selenocysteine-containing dehydrogenase
MNLPTGIRDIRGACPLDCPDTCSWIVSVKDGEAVALRGDPEHPYTRGSLCNKVVNYLSYTRSDDRVLYPLRRTGRKGSGAFTRITWDEALDEIAGRFQDVISEDGAEAIWPIAGSGNMGLIQGIYGAGRRLWNVLGTSPNEYTLCTVAGATGAGYTLGGGRVGMDPESFRFSKLILIWARTCYRRIRTCGGRFWRRETTVPLLWPSIPSGHEPLPHRTGTLRRFPEPMRQSRWA